MDDEGWRTHGEVVPLTVIDRHYGIAVPAVVTRTLEAEQLEGALADSYPGLRFAAVVSADLGDDVASILGSLSGVMAEIVCTDAMDETLDTGLILAMRALEEFGFGQDFVFSVPDLEPAIEYVEAVLSMPDRTGWEGAALLVIGPTAFVGRVERYLHDTERGASD